MHLLNLGDLKYLLKIKIKNSNFYLQIARNEQLWKQKGGQGNA